MERNKHTGSVIWDTRVIDLIGQVRLKIEFTYLEVVESTYILCSPSKQKRSGYVNYIVFLLSLPIFDL